MIIETITDDRKMKEITRLEVEWAEKSTAVRAVNLPDTNSACGAAILKQWGFGSNVKKNYTRVGVS